MNNKIKELEAEMKHKLEVLPKWARNRIRTLESELRTKQSDLDNALKANEIVNCESWMTLGMHMKEPLRLFTLNEYGSSHILTLDVGDIILLGRKGAKL